MKQLDPQIPSPIPDCQAIAPHPLIPNTYQFLLPEKSKPECL